MPINWDIAVLQHAQNVFAIPVMIQPVVSQPTEAPYAARGIFTDNAQDVALAESGQVSDQKITLSIRLFEFPVLPKIGDRVVLTSLPDYATDTLFWVADASSDGQGAVSLLLRLVDE